MNVMFLKQRAPYSAMDKANITLAQLRIVKSLARLTDEQLGAFLDFVELEGCPQQKVLFEEGQPGDCLYIVLKGQVRAFTRKKQGEEVTLKVLGEGDAFGDIAVFHETTRKASVEATQDSQLLKLSATSLAKLQAERPAIAAQFLQSLAQSLRQMYSRS